MDEVLPFPKVYKENRACEKPGQPMTRGTLLKCISVVFAVVFVVVAVTVTVNIRTGLLSYSDMQ